MVCFFIGWFFSYFDLNFIAAELLKGRKLLLFFFPSVLTLRLLMSYIYGAPILDVSRSHTTTQHSR